MKTTVKLTVAAMLIASGLSVSSAGFAAPCPGFQTLPQFIAAGSCTDEDKLYTYIASNFGAFDTLQLGIEISSFDVGPTEIHNFRLPDLGP